MLLAIFLVGVIALYFYLNGKYNEYYWKKRGVTFHPKNKVLGIFWNFMTENRAMFEILGDLYKQYPKEPALAFGSFTTPTLFTKDPANMRHILQTDFHSFSHRGVQPNESDILANNVLFLNGNKWKLVRQNMTSLFTAAKLRNMYYIMDKSAQDFVDYLKKNPNQLNNNAYDTLAGFCSAAISGAVFGINNDKSIFESPLLKMVRDALKVSWRMNIKFTLLNICPWLFKFLDLSLFNEHEKFFIATIKQVIRQRECENIKKHDFVDKCLSLQANGAMEDRETGLQIMPTDEVLAAQAFFFFVAGVDPCASAILCTFVELGRNPEILKRVHEEIDQVYEKHNGNLTFDVIGEMEYLERVFNETMRMYPPIGFLTRKCVKDSVLPNGNIKIDKGTLIFTPIYDVHHDPEHFPNPEVFDPDRFLNETLASDLLYMPFGKGNRSCIGARYARLQIQAGLVHFLRNFTVKTIIDGDKIKFKKEQVQVRPSNVDIKLIPRSSL